MVEAVFLENLQDSHVKFFLTDACYAKLVYFRNRNVRENLWVCIFLIRFEGDFFFMKILATSYVILLHPFVDISYKWLGGWFIMLKAIALNFCGSISMPFSSTAL